VLTVDLERLGVAPGERLLDAGCGGGRHCFGALDRGVHVVGIDLDGGALRTARTGIGLRRLADPALRGGVLQGDVLRLPFADGQFDRVICSEVMEHVHDYGGALRELARVLRPHGAIAVTIPTAITERLYLRLTREYFESPGGHIRIFRPRELARAMSRAGFAVDGVGFAHALHSPYWALRAVLGLHDERPAPTRAYREFLSRASWSPLWRRVERALDWVCPKSLVLYGRRTAGGLAESSTPAAPQRSCA
jgi:2-polyprenyl-3-methyl-5-hydroxy-6-metoxy-1,4-benzoquinol methylase